MQRRQIVITAGAAIAAFAVAFGIGKLAGGGEEATAAPPGEPAAAFDMPTAAIEADVRSEALPALKPKPTPTATPEPEPSAPAPPAPSSPAPAPAAPAPADPGPVTGGGED
jgi:hypothetical protein